MQILFLYTYTIICILQYLYFFVNNTNYLYISIYTQLQVFGSLLLFYYISIAILLHFPINQKLFRYVFFLNNTVLFIYNFVYRFFQMLLLQLLLLNYMYHIFDLQKIFFCLIFYSFCNWSNTLSIFCRVLNLSVHLFNCSKAHSFSYVQKEKEFLFSFSRF